MQKSTKVFALVLFLFCSQLQISSHLHDDAEIGFEACSVCLVGQSAEFDDALFSTAKPDVRFDNHLIDFPLSIYQINFDNSPLSLYLRGPPA